MPTRRRLAALVVIASLWAPAAAAAQSTTIPQEGASVSPQPPVQLDEGSSSSLPNTGTDPRLLFLAGIAMTLLGAGLRLRTADAELY